MLKTLGVFSLLGALGFASGVARRGATDKVAVAGSRGGRQVHLAIIVNKDNPVRELSFSHVRRIFMAEQSHWANGRRILIAMHERGQPERAWALRLIYKMTEAEYQRYFLQLSFSGQVQPVVREVRSSKYMRGLVAWAPGAIGYVPANELDDSVASLRIDGRKPGEQGYQLKLQLK